MVSGVWGKKALGEETRLHTLNEQGTGNDRLRCSDQLCRVSRPEPATFVLPTAEGHLTLLQRGTWPKYPFMTSIYFTEPYCPIPRVSHGSPPETRELPYMVKSYVVEVLCRWLNVTWGVSPTRLLNIEPWGVERLLKEPWHLLPHHKWIEEMRVKC